MSRAFPSSYSSLQNLSQMQQFISYKLSNPIFSQQQAYIMRVNNKYQKYLDKQYKEVQKMQKSVQYFELQAKKTRQYVNQMLVGIDRVYGGIQEEIMQYQGMCQQLELQRQEQFRQVTQHNTNIKSQQQSLHLSLNSLAQTHTQTLSTLQQTLSTHSKTSQTLQSQISQLQPIITQHSLQQSQLQILQNSIAKTQKQIQQCKDNVEKSEKFLQVLQNKMYDMFLARQEEENRDRGKKSEEIGEVVKCINGVMAVSKEEYEEEWNSIKAKYSETQLYKQKQKQAQKDQKYKQLKQKLLSGTTTPKEHSHAPLTGIDVQVQQTYVNRLKQMQQKMGQLAKEEQAAGKKCMDLEQEQANKDKEIYNLVETIKKIQENINK